MPSAIKDLFASERGLLCLVILIAATVLAAMGKFSYADWREYTTYIFGTYVVGKTATSVAQVIKGPPATSSVPSVTGGTLSGQSLMGEG